MLKYRGRYRVVFEVDRHSKIGEFSFIPCRVCKGANIVRHNSDTLNVFLPVSQTGLRLLNEYPDLFRAFQGGKEITLLFNESQLEQAAIILKARVKGKNMSPRPKRKVTLTYEQKQIYSERMREIQRSKNSLD